jgi:AmiR/NasT family two-component response regulator
MSENGAATSAEVTEQPEALQEQVDVGQHAISDLEDQAGVDRAVISQLEADGVVDRKEIEGLRTALMSCRRIGVAMGVVMVKRSVTEDQAFAILSTASQDTHRKVRDLADDVIRTGELHTEPTG